MTTDVEKEPIDPMVEAGAIAYYDAWRREGPSRGKARPWSAMAEEVHANIMRCFAEGLAAASAAHDEQGVTAADYEEVLADHRRLVRELDVLLNGETGAAAQASLIDIIAQVRKAGISIVQPKQAEESCRTQWWLAKLDEHGTAWCFDGPHSAREGADRAAYLMPALGLQKDGDRFAVVEARITEPRPVGNDRSAAAHAGSQP